MTVHETPKASLTLNKLGPGFGKGNVAAGVTNTLKLKRGKVTASLAASDRSVRPPGVKSLTDVVAQLDVKQKTVTANSKFEAGPRKYTIGATWEPKVADGLTALKGWYSNKDNLVNGEATIVLNKTQKALITFNQNKVLTSKYTYIKNQWVLEPTYNFSREAWSATVTRRLKGADTLKATYDVGSTGAVVEWYHRPLKLSLATTVSKTLVPKFTKPSLSAIYENTFDF